MPEFRKDIIVDEWVIIATERANRPESFIEQKLKSSNREDNTCPFDGGRESRTPPEILRMDAGGNIIGKENKDWQFRVVPNKYPALLPSAKTRSKRYGIYTSMDGFGFHEVVIHSPKHITSIADLGRHNLKILLELYIRRIKDIKRQKGIESIIVMVNQGRQAGASIEHSHSQIFAIPLIPPIIQRELKGTKKYYKQNKRCAVCELINFEKSQNKRIVYENKHFIVLQPYASRSPFETWIIPKIHNSNFENICEDEITSFSYCLKKVLDFFYEELNDPPFNYYIHTGPVNISGGLEYYHWNFEFIPKMKIRAGFEIAAGIDINVTSPEASAEFMKKSSCFR